MPGTHAAAAAPLPEPVQSPTDAQLSIQQVSAMLSLPAPTIRSWERRYRIPAADRNTGGHRRYTPDQLETLRRMRDLIAHGRRPAEAAALVAAGYAASPETLVTAFLHAAHDVAPDPITRTLDLAADTLGLDRTIDEVLLPAMRRIGDHWRTGRLDTCHEHLATHAAQTWLSRHSATPPAPPEPAPPEPAPPERVGSSVGLVPSPGPVVLSCGPRDHHTLGLEAFAALLRRRGLDCRLLGARTPPTSLERAVDDSHAAAVVLVCHLTAARPATVGALCSPRLRHVQLFYAGAAFDRPAARHGVPGHYLGTHLATAADHVTQTVTQTPAVDAARAR